MISMKSVLLFVKSKSNWSALRCKPNTMIVNMLSLRLCVMKKELLWKQNTKNFMPIYM
ncbi:hypothetical protein HanHA300_Chr05g0189431 [Helianthus annuus]|nr:hypothetical protein HanHA300_Chr05g0189431 [Helianthus annuus]KAJ0578158.1 hypothetical protein HanIR_Chr05g0244211 [Helianthus annuus]KAJ0748284.1 hypothetical protein HanOQP8_Chr05g0199521 [Helianthus annuus]